MRIMRRKVENRITCLKNLACLLITIAISFSVVAQQITGNIRGSVVDPSGAVLQAATVTAKQTETGLARVATTNHEGAYLLVELPVGQYQMEVEAQGFNTFLQEGILLIINMTNTVSLHLIKMC